MTDSLGAQQVFAALPGYWQHTLHLVWAEGAYQGQHATRCLAPLGIRLSIVKRADAHAGFRLLPRRWVVERTFAWLGRYRRLSKDYERCSRSSEAMVYLASIHSLLNHLAA